MSERKMVLPGRGMSWKTFFKELKNEYKRDGINDLAGSVTFFGLLAIFPFLIFLIALSSFFIQPQDAQVLVDELGQVAPGEVTSILGGQLQSLAQNNHGGLLTFGAIIALWSASSGVAAVGRALNTAYDVKEERPFLKVRGVAILMTLIGSAIGLAAAVAAIAAPAVADALGGVVGGLVRYLRLPVAGLMMMLVWALAYYLLPNTQQRFKFITPGSVVGVLLWVLASWGFSVYVQNFGSYSETYGALGGVVVLLLWMWISAQALLLGGEINAILEHRSPEGKRQGAKRLADKGVDRPKTTKEGDPGHPQGEPQPA